MYVEEGESIVELLKKQRRHIRSDYVIDWRRNMDPNLLGRRLEQLVFVARIGCSTGKKFSIW
jgi:hypothetical protein